MNSVNFTQLVSLISTIHSFITHPCSVALRDQANHFSEPKGGHYNPLYYSGSYSPFVGHNQG